MSPPTAADPLFRAWQLADSRRIVLNQPCVMGILNVTPDSFSDGGSYSNAAEAVAAARRMISDGATIIDVGGESTRPGSQPVHEAVQISRTVPVIESLRQFDKEHRAAISIDTTRASVAKAAIEAGADIINDISAGTDDPEMLALAARSGCGLILMHRLKPPREDSYSTQYTTEPDYRGDVYRAVRDHLCERVQAACNAGVDRRSIVIDPGLGFGKSVGQNYALAARLGELQRELELPALSAASRKSFLAQPPQAQPLAEVPPPRERLAASIAMTLSHWQAGVRLFRVHDVAAHMQALAVAVALDREQTAAAGC